MTNRHGRTWLTVFVAGSCAAAISSCGDPLGFGCTGELVPSLNIEVRDPTTGAPAARGVTGVSVHESGVETEFTASDDLRLSGDWPRELPGRHVVLLQKPGFMAGEPVHAFVEENGCHVEPVTVQMGMSPDPLAVPLTAADFIAGPAIDAWPADAGVRIYADTLEINGFVPTDCEELRAVAFRRGMLIHVQIEPSGLPLATCASPRLFQVRYILPPERLYLLVTNAFGFPVTLFNGQVAPS